MSQHKPSISPSFSYEPLEETLDLPPRAEKMMIGIPKETAFQEEVTGFWEEAIAEEETNSHE